MNKVIIKGRLANDAAVKETASGKIVTFTLADELRRGKERVLDAEGKPVVQYIDCAAKGKAADVAETLKKGAFVDAEAYLQVKRAAVDGKYFVNTTVWVNKFNEKAAGEPADGAEPAAEA